MVISPPFRSASVRVAIRRSPESPSRTSADRPGATALTILLRSGSRNTSGIRKGLGKHAPSNSHRQPMNHARDTERFLRQDRLFSPTI